jgi:TRAP-type transport system small permease protein
MLEKVAVGLKKGIFPLAGVAAAIGVLTLVAMVFIPLIDITMRRFLTSPLPGAYELSEFVLGMMVFTTLAYCGVKGVHIVVDVVTSHLPKKTQKILDIVIYCVSWIMMGIMSWQLIMRALTVGTDHEVSTILYIPTFPFVLIAGIGCALLTLVFLTQSLEKIAEVNK